ncbi:hypothetical protein HDV62DRAFT_40917 [Trichoderma sp. SZMC 28011]
MYRDKGGELYLSPCDSPRPWTFNSVSFGPYNYDYSHHTFLHKLAADLQLTQLAKVTKSNSGLLTLVIRCACAATGLARCTGSTRRRYPTTGLAGRICLRFCCFCWGGMDRLTLITNPALPRYRVLVE